MEIITSLGLIGTGGVLGIIIQHYLNRSSLASERIYQFQKEELLRYRQSAERIIEKLLLLEGYRELFLIYLKLSYEASCQEKSKFIDLNNTLDKTIFDNNKEQIATILFLYFSELSEDWNKCLEVISQMATLIHLIEMQVKNGVIISDWKEKIDQFNKLNQGLGDQPLVLSNKIKAIISQKEKNVKEQKSRLYIL